MGRSELYPWSSLEQVGDYFTVTEESGKDYAFMSVIVSTRNRNHKGRARYAVAKTSYGSIVLLAQSEDDVPFTDVEVAPGIRAISPEKALGKSQFSRTQSRIIAAMTHDERLANLPWWYDPRSGKLLMNTQVAHEEDKVAWREGRFNPGPETPYPERYHLDENLRLKSRDQLILEGVEDEDEWAGYSATGEEADDDDS